MNAWVLRKHTICCFTLFEGSYWSS